jgi:hypothetical protein
MASFCAAATQRVEMPVRFCLLYLSIILWDRLRRAALHPDALPFGRLWYLQISDAMDYREASRSHDAMIRVYAVAGKLSVLESYLPGQPTEVPP